MRRYPFAPLLTTLQLAALEHLITHLDALLEPARWTDFAPNGLQVPGPDEVGLVVTGVSANLELLTAAAAAGAGLVLVHHGLFWSGQPLALDRVAKRRLELLFAHDMGLAAYHLPLDGHVQHGNNARLAQELGAERWEPAFAVGGAPIGVVAELPAPGLAPDALLARVTALAAPHAAGRAPVAFLAGPERVRRVGILSGAGADEVPAAIAMGLDAFVTGEPAERNRAQAVDGGLHLIAAGHHATEVLGVQRMGELLAAELGVEHRFCDVPNPI